MNRLKLKKMIRKFKKNRGRWMMAVGVCILLVIFTTGDTGFYAQLRLVHRKHRLLREIKQAEDTQQQLQQEIDSLRSDPETAKQVARQKYGMGEPNEVIIKFNKPESD